MRQSPSHQPSGWLVVNFPTVRPKSAPSANYGVGEGEGFLYTAPPLVLTCPFVAVDAAGAVVVVVPCS